MSFIYKNGPDSMVMSASNDFLASNAWVFFAFSIDYNSGKVSIYSKSNDGVT